MIVKKILRLIVRDPAFLIRVLLIIIFSIVAVSEILILSLQSRQNQRLKNEMSLVKMIPEMQKKVYNSDVPVLNADSATLEGTSIRDGIPSALINGGIYQVGDVLGDRKIVEIDRGSVVLENVSTKEREILKIPYLF